MRIKTLVHHWRFEDGKQRTESFGAGVYRTLDAPPRGWYCWVYPADDSDFEVWMGKHCPNADVTFRFNSGDPMYTVYIKEDAEATLFQLRWS